MHVFGASVPLVCLFWHFIFCILALVNYVTFIKKIQRQDLKDTKLASEVFAIAGVIVYAFFSAPLFVYSYKYGSTHEKRVSRLHLGVALMFALSNAPIFVCELMLFLFYGNLSRPLNGMVFILSGIGTLFGAAISWFAYMRTVARALHKRRGIERQIVDANTNGAGPQLVFSPPVAGQPHVI